MIEVIVRYAPEWRGVNVWIVDKKDNGEWSIVDPVPLTVTTNWEPATEPPPPTFSFHGGNCESFLKSLANGLVEAGYRPDELKTVVSEKKAIQNHLEDMRRLVFKENTDV